MVASINFSNKSLDLVAPKLAARIDAGQEQARKLLAKLEGDVITDEVGYFGPAAQPSRRLTVGFDGDDVAVRIGSGPYRGFHKHAVRQLSERLDMPGGFVYDQLKGESWQRAAIADMLATHLANTTTRDRFLVRSVDGQVRAVLSDAYRRLSSPQIARAFSAGLEGLGAVPFESKLDDLKWSVRAILPRPIELTSLAHGTEYVGVGLRLTNSDFGAGALDLQAEVLRLVCINGMVRESTLHAVHLGKRLPENLSFSEETYALDTRLQCQTMREALPQLVTPSYIEKALEPSLHAMGVTIDPQVEIKGLVRAARITKTQATELEGLVMNRDGSIVPVGPVTRWTMAQAVSGLANNDALSIDDAAKLREVAAGVLVGV